MPDTRIQPGTRFNLVREVGLNSLKSSRVFLAEDTEMQQKVCLKIAERDFQREFDVLTELSSLVKDERRKNSCKPLPTIPQPYESGKIKFEGKKQHYLSRQFIEGINLFAYFQIKPFDSLEEKISDIIDAINSAAIVVGYIHNQGKYHRDLKPYDFIAGEANATLIDFESVLDEGEYCRDMHPLFSAPEVTGGIYSVSPDHKSDIYSLGMIAFALLLAQNPEAYQAFMKKEFYKPGELNKAHKLKIPDKLMKVISKATSWMPDDRYDKTINFVYALEEARPS